MITNSLLFPLYLLSVDTHRYTRLKKKEKRKFEKKNEIIERNNEQFRAYFQVLNINELCKTQLRHFNLSIFFLLSSTIRIIIIDSIPLHYQILINISFQITIRQLTMNCLYVCFSSCLTIQMFNYINLIQTAVNQEKFTLSEQNCSSIVLNAKMLIY